MQRFRYWQDPACLVCCLAYVVNRFVLKPQSHIDFFHSYFNDLLLIPCALPFLLFVQRRLGIRKKDAYPDVGEVMMPLIVWSVLFEWIGPMWMRGTVADRWDVVAYAVGAFLASLWWRIAGIGRPVLGDPG